MDRDTIIALATLPDSRTRAALSGFFCEARGALEVQPVQSSGTDPESQIVRGLVAKFVNIAIMVAGDSESVDALSVSSARAPLLAVAG